MGIKEKYSVSSINPNQTHEWLLKKHYAKRIPSISYSFGLFYNSILVGVLTIGKPASNSLCVGVCGECYSKYVYELNRLCVNDGLDKNSLSFFLSRSLKLINESLIIVSYSDTYYGHTGYIYQATNWIYTGATKERTDIGFADNKHSRHYDKSTDKKMNRKFRSSKHRYIMFIGNLKTEFSRALKYPILSYPKSENKRYDSSHVPTVQGILFT